MRISDTGSQPGSRLLKTLERTAPLSEPLSEAEKERRAKEREDARGVASTLGEVDTRSRTARRDGLAEELQRVLQLLETIKRIGDPKAAAKAAEQLARRIAGLSRQLAEAERDLPAGAAGKGAGGGAVGAAGATVPKAAAPATGAGPAAPSSTPAGTSAAASASPDTAAATGPADTSGPGADSAVPAAAPAGSVQAIKDGKPKPGDRDGDGEPDRTDKTPDSADRAGADRAGADRAGTRAQEPAAPSILPKEKPTLRSEGTAVLLKAAAEVLEELRKVVEKAANELEFSDPEEADKQRKNARDIRGLSNTVAGYSSGLETPRVSLSA